MSVKKNKKTKKWYARVNYKVAPGEYKQKTKTGFDSQKEALLWEAETKLKLEKGLEIDQSLDEPSFAQYFEEWVDTYKIGTGLSESTENKYTYVVKLVHDHFKNKPLSKVTRKDYQVFLNKRGKGNGRDIVEKTNSYIKQAMADALHDGLIEKDPTYKALITYDNKPSSRLKYWNLDEFKKLMQALSYEVELKNAMLYLQGMTGLRIGEVYGLSWKDIDFKKKSLTVSRGYDHSRTLDFTEGKNRAALRTIVLDDQLIQYLKQYKLKYSKVHPNYLFLTPENKPGISYVGLMKHLKKVCRELEIEELSSHSLRHTHCSVLIFEKVDLHYISKRLGHSNLTETIKTYSHLIDELKQQENTKAIEALNNLVQN